MTPIWTKLRRRSTPLAKPLAENNSDCIAYEHSAQIINKSTPDRNNWLDTLLGQLRSEGVLTDDVVLGHDARNEKVIRFTYQQLADYKVASTLLEPLRGDPESLIGALAAGRPLRNKVLKAPAGWVEALSVQIPEQFGLELMDVAAQWKLESSTQSQWDEAFVISIAVRKPSAVTKRSVELLTEIKRRSPELRALVLDAILTVAPLPEHPLNAYALHENLKSLSLPERDLAWSIRLTLHWIKAGRSTGSFNGRRKVRIPTSSPTRRLNWRRFPLSGLSRRRTGECGTTQPKSFRNFLPGSCRCYPPLSDDLMASTTPM